MVSSGLVSGDSVGVAVVGCGHWGLNYVRLFAGLGGSSLLYACDPREESRAAALGVAPRARVVEGITEALADPAVGALVISTPAAGHYDLARRALEADKHVLVEKPIALTPLEAARLCILARERRRVLVVGHTFLYHDAIVAMRELVRGEDFGSLYYLEAKRTHLGLVREDVNAVWDLAPHDISIFAYLVGEWPTSVSAAGGHYLRDGREDFAFITFRFPGGVLANLRVSWMDAGKVREVIAVGSHSRIVFNDLDSLEKLRVFKKGIAVSRPVRDFGEFQLLLRDGDIVSPRLQLHEPLRSQCEHFIECVRDGIDPRTPGEDGMRVVQVLQATDASLRRDGAPVDVDQAAAEEYLP